MRTMIALCATRYAYQGLGDVIGNRLKWMAFIAITLAFIEDVREAVMP